MEMQTQFYSGNPKGIIYVGDLSVYGVIILEGILINYVVDWSAPFVR